MAEYEGLADELAGLVYFAKVNVDREVQLASRYSIRPQGNYISATIFFMWGRTIERIDWRPNKFDLAEKAITLFQRPQGGTREHRWRI
jgi:hypothetical protein